MAILYSTQMAQATPEVRIAPIDLGGEVRVAYFRADLASTLAQNDVVVLTQLPVGARVLRGRVDFTDFGTSVTLDIGPESNPDLFADGADIASAAGQLTLADTRATGLGYVAVASTSTLYNRPSAGFERVLATFLSANPDAGVLEGYIEFVHQ